MENGTDDHWRHYHRSFRIFGPLMRISDVVAQSREAGFGAYDDSQQQTLLRLADYAYSYLAQPHPNLGRDGNVCPFVATALEKGLFRVTVTGAAEVDTVEAAMTAILPVFREMAPQSPPPTKIADGDQIYKAILIGFPEVAPDEAVQVIDELQKRLKSLFIRAGLMIGQFHPNCPAGGLHNPNFRPFQTPLACLAIRHVTKYDAVFMDRDDYLDGYLRLFGLEGHRRLQALAFKHSADKCPIRVN